VDQKVKEKYARLIDKYDVELHKLPALIKDSVDLNGELGIYVSNVSANYYLELDIQRAINKAISKNIETLRALADAREQDILK